MSRLRLWEGGVSHTCLYVELFAGREPGSGHRCRIRDTERLPRDCRRVPRRWCAAWEGSPFPLYGPPGVPGTGLPLVLLPCRPGDLAGVGASGEQTPLRWQAPELPAPAGHAARSEEAAWCSVRWLCSAAPAPWKRALSIGDTIPGSGLSRVRT